jgi:HKD family nuclease
MRYRIGLNRDRPLLAALTAGLEDATACDIAVAYAKSSGVAGILELLPKPTRAVVGLGFGLTDPDAIELLATAAEVRVVTASASRFHPKLYLAHRSDELVVLSGSGNLTMGGLCDNNEQYEELRFAANSRDAKDQHARFATLWALGVPLAAAKHTPEWARYLALVEARRTFEREQRRLGRLPPRTRRRAAASRNRLPGYVALTAAPWWDHQRAARYAEGAVFMRNANSGRFRRLEAGGLFFHLVTRPGHPEHERAIEGFSEYHDGFEEMALARSWRQFGPRVGYPTLEDYYGDRGTGTERLGLIHLEGIRQADRPVLLSALRAEGVRFDAHIQQGRGLDLDDVATVLRLGGSWG